MKRLAAGFVVLALLGGCTTTRKLKDDVREGRALLRGVSFPDRDRESRRAIFLKNADEDVPDEVQ